MPPRASYRFSSTGSRPTSSSWPRSAPEQNVPPAPLMTAAPTRGSRSASSQAATNWPASSLFRAFLVAGAFTVMNATPSVISRSIMGWLLGWIAGVAVGGLVQAPGERGAALAELGRLERGERDAQPGQVQHDHVEGVRARGEQALPFADRLDHRDRGRHHGRNHVGGRVQQHPGPPAVRPRGDALADEPGGVRRVGRARPGAGAADILHPVQPEAAPLALVQVVRHQVPAPARVDQAVRLDVTAAVLPGAVPVAEAQPLALLAGQGDEGEVVRLYRWLGREQGPEGYGRGGEGLHP